MNEKNKVISIPVLLKARLDTARLHPRDTYSIVIGRLLDCFDMYRDDYIKTLTLPIDSVTDTSVTND